MKLRIWKSISGMGVLALILGSITGFSQGSITVTSGTPTPGNQIYVDWTLNVPDNVGLDGKLYFYLNSLPLPGGNAPAQKSGKYNFMPVPGCNLLTVSLIEGGQVRGQGGLS